MRKAHRQTAIGFQGTNVFHKALLEPGFVFQKPDLIHVGPLGNHGCAGREQVPLYSFGHRSQSLLLKLTDALPGEIRSAQIGICCITACPPDHIAQFFSLMNRITAGQLEFPRKRDIFYVICGRGSLT